MSLTTIIYVRPLCKGEAENGHWLSIVQGGAKIKPDNPWHEHCS